MEINRGDNYSAWKVKVEDFPTGSSINEQLMFLLKYAILAPSSHNSQPWLFEINNNTIIVKKKLERCLPHADSEGFLMMFAIGCAVENLLIVADYFGFECRLKMLEDHASKVCEIEFINRSDKKTDSGHLIHFINKRHTNRNEYFLKMPPEDFLFEMKKLADDNISIHLISEEGQKRQVAEVLLDSRVKAFDNKKFRTEMALYKRNNFTKSYYGMPGFTMGFSNIISLFTGLAIKNFNVLKVIKDKEISLLTNGTPILVIMGLAKKESKHVFGLGKIFQRFSLCSTKENLNTAFQAIPGGQEKLQKILQTNFFPLASFRLGYSKEKIGFSPRMPVEKIMI